MRISDWSSDVCSSDLAAGRQGGRAAGGGRQGLCHRNRQAGAGGDLAFDSRRPMAEKVGFTPEASTSASSPHMAAEPLPASRSEERRVGQSVSVRVALGGRRIIQNKNTQLLTHRTGAHL